MSDLRWTRTANAGGLLELDGVSILLDGVCGAAGPYRPTPPDILDRLVRRPVSLAAFTHAHPDHLDPSAMTACLRAWGGASVLGGRDVAGALSPWPVTVGEGAAAGSVTVTPIPSRHIGAVYREVEHYSLLVEGSRRCLFLGDAAPTQWKGWAGRAEVLLAPFAYAATEAGWRIAGDLAPRRMILLHMPGRDNDPDGLWQAVEGMLSRKRGIPVDIPDIGETVTIL